MSPDSRRSHRHTLWFDAFALLAFVGSLWNWLGSGWLSLGRPDVVYVSPSGSDWLSTGSETSPVATITEALRRVATSGRVRLLDGEYTERVHVRRGGERTKPLVIEAVNPGRAGVTWKSEDRLPIATGWKEEGDGVYSADVRWPVYWVRDGERSLLHVPYGGLEHLRRLVRLPAADGAFANSDGRLFVFLNGRHPGESVLETHREVPAPREWGVHKSSNVWIEADDVVVRGIAFDFGIGSAIRIRDADRVRVENCAFTAASHGIRVDGGEARHLEVDRCLYHNYPQGSWSTGWLNWEQMYACYSDNGLLKAPMSIVQVSGSVAVHCADGMHVSSASADQSERSIVKENWIAFTTDDGLELDGPGRNLTVQSNLLLDCFVGISSSPVREGPVVIRENVCWNRAEAGENAHLKWLTPPRQGKETRNMTIEDNLFVGGTPCWWRPEVAVIDTEVLNNLFAARKEREDAWPASVQLKDNELHAIDDPGDLSPRHFEKHMAASGNALQWKALVSAIQVRPGPDWWDFGRYAATTELAGFASQLLELGR
jgi:hypothetical protein